MDENETRNTLGCPCDHSDEAHSPDVDENGVRYDVCSVCACDFLAST